MPRLLLVLLVALPLAAAEVPISDVRYGPYSTDQRQQPVVSAGDGFLVLWSEFQNGVYPLTSGVRAYDLDGVALAPTATFVAGSTPHAVWTGAEYLVVTAPLKSRFAGSGEIAVTRIQRNGTRVGAPVLYALESRQSRVLSIAWNGTHAVALVESDAKHLLRLDAQGRLVNDEIVPPDVVAVAPDGADFFLRRRGPIDGFAAGGGRYAVLEGQTVSILDRAGVEIERLTIPGEGARSLAWDGARWITAVLDESGRVCTASFTGAHDLVRACRDANAPRDPYVGATTRRSFVAWWQANQIVTDSGTASTVMAVQSAQATAVDAIGLLVAWREAGQLRIGGLTHDGKRRPEVVLDEDARMVAMSAAREQTLVVWELDRGIRAIRLDAAGRPLFPVIDLGPGTQPRVATDGETWLVGQATDGVVTATTITRDGVIAGVRDVARGTSFALAAVSTGYLLLSTRDDGPGLDLHKLNAEGLPVATIEHFIADGAAPEIGCTAATCLAIWRRASDAAYAAVVVSHDGQPLAEPRLLGLDETCCGPRIVLSTDGGRFRVFHGETFLDVAADGTPTGVTRWNGSGVLLAGASAFAGRTLLVYTRDGRVYVRDLPPRRRAARR